MRPTLLCNVNFPSNTGFAWNYIERIYARLADHFAGHGIRTLVAYPSVPRPPETLLGSAAEAVELDATMSTPASALRLAARLRKENVRVLYLTDRPALHLGYGLLRAGGVRRIVVHDHASGLHRAPEGAKRWVKWTAARTPFVSSDAVVAVSDFVARRQVRVGLVPPDRVTRIYNSVSVPESEGGFRGTLRSMLGLSPERPLIACACRATAEKGVAHLLRAFDRLLGEGGFGDRRPALVYLGDGPALSSLQDLQRTLRFGGDIHLAGYQARAADLLTDADVCVVPSVWDEAFGLAVVEPMARGKPVIASRVGGIPELIREGVTGLLVPPGNEEELTRALGHLLRHPEQSREMGAAAKRWVSEELSLQSKLSQLLPLLESGFEGGCKTAVAARPAGHSAPASTGLQPPTRASP